MSAVVALPLQQGSDAWLEARRSKYGASETPQIGRLTGREARVWRSKLGEPEELDALWLSLGHLLEPWALRLWSDVQRRDVEPGAVLAETDGMLLASLDGASRGEPVECKVRCKGAPDWDAWTADTIPAGVELQVRQQAALAERYLGRRLEAAHVSAILLNGYGIEHRVYRVALTPTRRDEWADLWVPYVGQWHDKYVVGRVPPPDAEVSDVAVLVEPERTTRRDPTADELALLAELVTAETERKARAQTASEAERARDRVRDDLARRLGPDHTIPGLTWKRWGKNLRLTLENA